MLTRLAAHLRSKKLLLLLRAKWPDIEDIVLKIARAVKLAR
jgi:hypothetical protein